MKEWLYRLLVSRTPQIKERYLNRRNSGTGRLSGLAYLVWLNLRYGLIPGRRQDMFLPDTALRLPGERSESSRSAREAPEQFARRLAEFDIVSFDVFDTLLFRPFSDPRDMFGLIGLELNYPGFQKLRIQAEEQARRKKWESGETREVTLGDIWEIMERETGIPRQKGMDAEWEWERRCCFANPYLLQTVKALCQMGKTVIAVSDMYLSRKQIELLLKENGFPRLTELFVSSEYGCSKSSGGLYDLLRQRYGRKARIIHIGDNIYSDVKSASSHGVETDWYPNVNSVGKPFRPGDMSALTGSIYRGLVNAHIHCGLMQYSPEYEYGFLYGGLFVTGYCRFIHTYCQCHGIEKILFLSRDGCLLLRAYRAMYPEEAHRTAYACWSRLAAVKLTADIYRSEYFESFLFHRTGSHITLRQALDGMELTDLLPKLCRERSLAPETVLTYKTARVVKQYLTEHWQEVLSHYTEQQNAAKSYYQELLDGCRTAAAVDIGWAGSGAVMLDCAVSQIWGLSCRITGILAGTLSANSPEADAASPLLWGGRLVSYLFSEANNRDLWRFHDADKKHNLYWELLLGAPEGSLIGFYPNRNNARGWQCRLKKSHADPAKINQIHQGAMDFVQLFLETEKRLGLTVPISGRDAYAPMAALFGRHNRTSRRKLEELLDEAQIVC